MFAEGRKKTEHIHKKSIKNNTIPVEMIECIVLEFWL